MYNINDDDSIIDTNHQQHDVQKIFMILTQESHEGTFDAALGISPDRNHQLIFDILKPAFDWAQTDEAQKMHDGDGPDIQEILNIILSQAKTQEEVIYLTFRIGNQIGRLQMQKEIKTELALDNILQLFGGKS